MKQLTDFFIDFIKYLYRDRRVYSIGRVRKSDSEDVISGKAETVDTLRLVETKFKNHIILIIVYVITGAFIFSLVCLVVFPLAFPEHATPVILHDIFFSTL